MVKRVPEGYKKLFDAIADVLHLYEFDQNDFRCMGLLSRINRAVKACEFDSFIIREGVRCLYMDRFKDWSKPYIEELKRNEQDEKLKLENLKKRNEAALEMLDAEKMKRIIVMVKPKKKDDWFSVLLDAIREFETEEGHTPNKQQLWSKLNNSPPHGHDVEYVEKHGAAGFQLFGGKHLDREAFRKRYQRMYPSKN